MPETDLSTIPRALARAAQEFADDEALVDEQRRLSFAQLAAAVDDATAALLATGIAPGDRVAIWAPNIAPWVVASLAVHAAGAVLVPCNTRFKGPEAAYVLERADARLLFTVTDFLQTDYVELLRDAPPVPSLEEIVVLRGTTADATTSWDDFIELGRSVPRDDVIARRDAIGRDDLCNILFTSGTTGKPKGAMLAHEPTVRAYTAWSDVVGLQRGDRYLVVNPFFHSFGLNAGILAAILKGATIIPHAVFDVDSVMARVDEERVTMLPGVPTIYQSFLDHPRRADYDLSTLRLSVTGAASVPVELIRRMRTELTFTTIVTGYGLTEATGIATMCRHDDDVETIATTAGRAIPDVEVVVADDGEVLVRGYNIMKGFIHDPEATAEAIDAEGWLHTGDIGVLDERGNLRITDRKKDMFIVGGFNAYPAEIEGMILEHPSIAQVAVVGAPDQRMGEVGYAYVIPRLGASVDLDELRTWCRGRMANYKVPAYIEVVDALPLNASGKVLKYELRDKAAAGLER
jgi:acyl-CoA synthetase (AMP-forming)/AMP-acid ligase II